MKVFLPASNIAPSKSSVAVFVRPLNEQQQQAGPHLRPMPVSEGMTMQAASGEAPGTTTFSEEQEREYTDEELAEGQDHHYEDLDEDTNEDDEEYRFEFKQDHDQAQMSAAQ